MLFKRAIAVAGLLMAVQYSAWGQQSGSQTPSEPAPPPDPDVVAVVNGEKITRTEVLEMLLWQFAPTVVDRLVDQKLMEQAARKRGVTVTEADLEKAYAAYKRKASNPAVIEDWERQVGRAAIMSQLKPRIIYVKLGELITQVSDDELMEVRASHILVKVSGSNETAAKEKIEKALAELRAGKDFAEVAKTYSEDPGSAQNGGDLGFFGRGAMVKEFEDAVFSAKVGEIVGPIKSQYGYHIIKVTEIKPASQLDPAVLDERREAAILRKTSDAVRQYLNEERKKAQIEKYKLLMENFLKP
ncbi:MAG: peptidylprolyl isomerase [Armatimonadota bacterium]